MTPSDCCTYRRWLERPEGHDEGVVPRFARDHVRECDDCGSLTRAYNERLNHTRDLSNYTLGSHIATDRFVAHARAELERMGPLSTWLHAMAEWINLHRFGLSAGVGAVGVAAVAAMAVWWIGGPTAPSRVSPLTGLRVTSAEEATEWTNGDAVSRPLERTAQLAAGSVVETGADGGVKLVDAAIARVGLGHSSLMRVEAWSASEAKIALDRGESHFRVEKRVNRPPFTVLTPVALIEVVGTEFRVVHTEAGGTEIVVEHGRVRVTRQSDGLQRLLSADERWAIAPGDGPVSMGGVLDRLGTEGRTELGASAAARMSGPVEPQVGSAGGVWTTEVPLRRSSLTDSLRNASARRPAASSAGPARSEGEVVDDSDAAPSARAAKAAKSTTARATPAHVSRAGLGGGAKSARDHRAAGSAVAPTLDAPARAEVDTAEAETVAREEPSVDSASIRFRDARRALAGGNTAIAIEMLSELTATTAADRAQRLRLLGDAHALNGDATKAVEAYGQALAFAAGSTRAALHAERARLFGDTDGSSAEAEWRAVLQAAPQSSSAAEAHHELAKRAVAVGNSAAAEQHWLGVLRDHSKGRFAAAALASLGRHYMDDGRAAEARSLFGARANSSRAAIAEAALLGMARADLALGRHTEARATLDRYEARFPSGRRQAEAKLLRAALTPQ